MQQQTPFDGLIDALITGSITAEQRSRLNAMLGDPQTAEAFKARLEQELATGKFTPAAEESIDKWLEERIQSGVTRRIHEIHEQPQAPVHRVHFLKRFRWVAAAVFIGIALTAYLLLFNNTSQPEMPTVAADVAAPEKNRASIQLADGRTVYLDQVANGTVTRQGNVQMTKLADGQIVYAGTSDALAYNTITNPKGSKVIDMAFADGSHIWLNAGSSVKFPVAFIGNTREVEITGEAYLSVKHNDKMPFVVRANGQVIEDLGTEFNVNAYSNETTVRTTLIEGEVKIGNITLKPGEQLDGKKITRPDVKEVLAWKNNQFVFNGASMEVVMRQLERWYDIEVKYAGRIPDDTFQGTVPRDYPLSDALKVLEASGVKFSIQGKQLLVQQ